MALLRNLWSLTLYPDAAEAGGCLLMRPRQPGIGLYWEPSSDEASRFRWQEPDPERSKIEAARRARAKIRRYCAANGLNRLGTLTYAGEGCHDPSQLRSDLADFFRALRRELGRRPLPYLWVPELHPGGHGFHVHFAVGRFVRHGLIRDTWARGHVHIKRIGNLPVGSTSLAEARVSAAYLAKYASKAIGEDAARPKGLHRYEVAQGFQPTKVSINGPSSDAVIARAVKMMGGRLPKDQWRSSDNPQWLGPPAVWVAW